MGHLFFPNSNRTRVLCVVVCHLSDRFHGTVLTEITHHSSQALPLYFIFPARFSNEYAFGYQENRRIRILSWVNFVIECVRI